MNGRVLRSTVRFTLQRAKGQAAAEGARLSRKDLADLRGALLPGMAVLLRSELLPKQRAIAMTDTETLRAWLLRALAEHARANCGEPECVYESFGLWLDERYQEEGLARLRRLNFARPKKPRNGSAALSAPDRSPREPTADFFRSIDRTGAALRELAALNPDVGALIYERLSAPWEGNASIANVRVLFLAMAMKRDSNWASRTGRPKVKVTPAACAWVWTVEALRQLCGTNQAEAREIWSHWFPDTDLYDESGRDYARWFRRVRDDFEEWEKRLRMPVIPPAMPQKPGGLSGVSPSGEGRMML